MFNSSNNFDKDAIRSKFLHLRKIYYEHNEKNFNKKNEKILLHIRLLLNLLHKKLSIKIPKRTKYLLSLYYPLPGEVDISKILIYTKENWTFLLPKITSPNKLNMVEYDYNKIPLIKSKIKNLLTPSTNNILYPNVIILPGIAFSLEGYRIGFGKGLYDQYINDLKKDSLFLVGVCMHKFLINTFLRNKHDVKLNYIVTEKMILKL